VVKPKVEEVITEPAVFNTVVETQKDDKKKKRKTGGNGTQAPPTYQSGEKKGIKCYLCQEPHLVTECPSFQACRELANRKKASVNVVLSSAAPQHKVTFNTVVNVNELIDGDSPLLLKQFDVLLDNQATAGVFKEKAMLTNIRQVSQTAEIKAFCGETVTTNLQGEFLGLSTVWYHPEVAANILPFGEIETSHRISYHQGVKMVVHLDDGSSYSFNKSVCDEKGNGLYIGDFSNVFGSSSIIPASVNVATVAGNELLFSKKEVLMARKARDLMKSLGYISPSELMKMIRVGAISNCPVVINDVLRAEEIYGADLASVKGKTVHHKAPSVRVEPVIAMVQQQQTLHLDIMFIDGIPFLIAIATPLYLLTVAKLKSREVKDVRPALFSCLSAFKSANFYVSHILSDGEGAIKSLENELNALGVMLNPAGPGQHVPLIERKIRQVKERVRAILSVLPYSLPRQLLEYLVDYAVSRINVTVTSSRDDNLTPREAFLGRKLDYVRDLRVSFGEYAQCEVVNVVNKNSVSIPRAEGAIALYPSGNIQGSWKFLNLSTLKVITRDQFKVLPIPQVVIDRLNALARVNPLTTVNDPVFSFPSRDMENAESSYESSSSGFSLPTMVPIASQSVIPPSYDGSEVVIASADDVVPSSSVSVPPVDVPLRGDPPAAPGELSIEAAATTIPPTVDDSASISDDSASISDASDYEDIIVEENGDVIPDRNENDEAAEVSDEASISDCTASVADDTQSVESSESAESAGFTPHYNLRERKPPRRDSSYHYTFNISIKNALKQHPEDALSSIIDELLQMLGEGVWKPKMYHELSREQSRKRIRSFMFLKEKFLPNGAYQRLKARLVAGGDGQDRTAYSSVSSPTISLTSLFIIATIAAKEARHVRTIDFVGAYLNAFLEEEVFMVLDPVISAILSNIDPSYADYIDAKQCITVKLEKALYGCIESALLWYEHLSNSLLSLGFIRNPMDTCVFNLGEGEEQCTVGIYVDDAFITCRNESVITQVLDKLLLKYKKITIHDGLVHNYLGMIFDYSVPKEVKVTMEGYISEVLSSYRVAGKAVTPALPHLYEIRDSPLLDDEAKDEFHSRVAKLLYLAKRVRPDILPLCIFLATRVREPTADDWSKLDRGLK
jgi:hypothetical protein